MKSQQKCWDQRELGLSSLSAQLFLFSPHTVGSEWHARLLMKRFVLICRKLAKSTLVLVLVFGVHYIVFICLPHSFTGLGWEIRMHCELFFNSFQVRSAALLPDSCDLHPLHCPWQLFPSFPLSGFDAPVFLGS